jgi:hypothetical protein
MLWSGAAVIVPQNLLSLDGLKGYVLVPFTLTPALSLRERGPVD